MESNDRRAVLAGAVAAALACPGLAGAQATSAHTVDGNMSIVSDYRFRGISQTFAQPAIQCGIDYSHTSGFYLGNWNSNVSEVSFVDGAIEMDVYGGFRKGFGEATVDVGLLQYYYPNARAEGVKYDTLEGYAGVSWRWLTVKYSHTFSDWFGVQAGAMDSAGSGYIDLSASYEIAPKLTLAGHIGQQKVKNFSNLDYTDYKIGLTYDLNGWGLGAAYIDTDAGVFYTGAAAASGKSIDLGKSTVVLSVSKLF